MKINQLIRQRIRKQIVKALRNPENREVVVRSPFSMSSGELEKIKDFFPSLNNAHLSHELDETLLGGFVIVDGSTIIDYSVKSRLNDVVGSLLESYH